ncbi:MAG: Ig-like domain-containing protein [Cyclobacteriaceae bacterium]
MKIVNAVILFVGFNLLASCDTSDTEPTPQLSLLTATIDGATLGANENVSIEAAIVLVFSASLDQTKFLSETSLSSGSSTVNFTVNFANGNTKATITPELDYGQSYVLSINAGTIGDGGERLADPLNYLFTTAQDDVIRSMTPCVSTSACLQSVELQGSQGMGTFEFYSNYPIYEENAEWENLTQAIIVVHGASHDPDNYYSYLTSTLNAESLSESTVLISPFFRETSTGSQDDFYWSGNQYREGSQSSNNNKISSFTIIDKLIDQLANADRFPVLNKIIVTGHSSGAAFTHVYAASNTSESSHQEIQFEYLVANSQFFYYPDGQRINESNNQLYTPAGCAVYDIWPLGFNSPPPYLVGINETTFNSQFVNRSITYLLGNGNQSDPTLNTSDCENTLQGSTRYNRGENMFRYMELVYPSTHSHSKVVVNGIGHDGQGMYQSPAFKSWLSSHLN